MFQTRVFKSLIIGVVIVLLAGSATVGIFIAGERVGRYSAARTVSDVVRGEREPEALEQAALLPEETEEKGYTARGLVISSGSGEMTIETKTGRLRTVILTQQTRVRSGGMKVEQTTLRVGDTVFILGSPTEGAASNALVQQEETAPQVSGTSESATLKARPARQEVTEQAPKKCIRATLVRVVKRGE
jgi:hydrogenase maturation factor